MPKRILIMGGDVRSGQLLKFLEASTDYQVVGVWDKNENTPILTHARGSGINQVSDWREFIKEGKCDAILNLTGDKNLSVEIAREAAPLGIDILGQATAKLIWALLRQAWARDVYDRLQAQIEPSWSFEEILILLLEATRKLVHAEAGIIFTVNGKEIDEKISWGLSGEEVKKILSKINDLEKLCKNFYEERNPSFYIPLFSEKIFIGGIVLLETQSEDIEENLLNLIRNKVATIISHTKTLHKTIQLSNIDGLTGLYNHRFFHERMEKELYRAQQYDLNLSLIILDIDDFKKFNDTYGHLAGDQQLRAIAKILKFILRETDFIARYGGEEFAVILPETPLKGAQIAAERVRRAIENQDFGYPLRVTASFGVSGYPESGVTKNEIIDKADKALYLAKNQGKNRVCIAE
ncbi:MAG: GGDEF domain-containing protein [Elusimicrobia bacterium]|nr:GGDEF domain-containing protein [Elusimicrobiota bacterium]